MSESEGSSCDSESSYGSEESSSESEESSSESEESSSESDESSSESSEEESPTVQIIPSDEYRNSRRRIVHNRPQDCYSLVGGSNPTVPLGFAGVGPSLFGSNARPALRSVQPPTVPIAFTGVGHSLFGNNARPALSSFQPATVSHGFTGVGPSLFGSNDRPGLSSFQQIPVPLGSAGAGTSLFGSNIGPAPSNFQGIVKVPESKKAEEIRVSRPNKVPSPDQAKKPKECLICLSELSDGENTRFLSCFHAFHAACIDQWLQMNSSCPCCRTPATS